MKLTDQSPMPFGTHKDKPMEKVPADYLLWLYDDMSQQGFHDNTPARAALWEYMEENHTALCKEAIDYDPKYKPSR
jgi:hypothetical protein